MKDSYDTSNENVHMLKDFPKESTREYLDGDKEPYEDDHRAYGKPRVVFRIAMPTDGQLHKGDARAIAAQSGVKYDSCFRTGRYWVFVVME